MRHELVPLMAMAASVERWRLLLEAKESARVKCERGGVTGERCGVKCHVEARRGLAAQDAGDARRTRGADVLKRSGTVAADSVRPSEPDSKSLQR